MRLVPTLLTIGLAACAAKKAEVTIPVSYVDQKNAYVDSVLDHIAGAEDQGVTELSLNHSNLMQGFTVQADSLCDRSELLPNKIEVHLHPEFGAAGDVQLEFRRDCPNNHIRQAARDFDFGGELLYPEWASMRSFRSYLVIDLYHAEALLKEEGITYVFEPSISDGFESYVENWQVTPDCDLLEVDTDIDFRIGPYTVSRTHDFSNDFVLGYSEVQEIQGESIRVHFQTDVLSDSMFQATQRQIQNVLDSCPEHIPDRLRP